MEHKIYTLVILLILLCTNQMPAQIGIGTTSPSNASAIDISSSLDGSRHRGFLPPRVPDVAARATILPNSTTDVGMEIFLTSTGCLQVWNGLSWENMHCINDIAFTGVAQNFDQGTSWGYTSDVAFFDNGTDGFYGITDASNSIFSNLTTLTNNFLGIRDLDDEGNGTSGLATVQFASINVLSALSGTTLAFDWEFYRLDTGDNAYYQIIIDGIPQMEIQFINPTSGDVSDNGTVSVAIPGGTATVELILRFEQDGQNDVFGFDNFRIY